jgi:hypothetical protein
VRDHLRILAPIRFFIAAAAVLCPVCALAQTIEVPRSAASATAPAGTPAQFSDFDNKHLADRPYAGGLPKPTFPSTQRVQREFVVEYVYDYAFSSYTPEVKLPIIPPAQMKRDTPENALIAMFSAMRAGDFDDFVKSWDDTGQKQLLDDAKNNKQDAAFWRNIWSQVFASAHETILVDRIETRTYVILDAQLPGANLMRVPTTFKLVNGKWLATNDLSTKPMLYLFRPNLAGILNREPFMPTAGMDPGNPAQADAQQQFLDQHAIRSQIVQTGR